MSSANVLDTSFIFSLMQIPKAVISTAPTLLPVCLHTDCYFHVLVLLLNTVDTFLESKGTCVVTAQNLTNRIESCMSMKLLTLNWSRSNSWFMRSSQITTKASLYSKP
jgi:hypothetical protein